MQCHGERKKAHTQNPSLIYIIHTHISFSLYLSVCVWVGVRVGVGVCVQTTVRLAEFHGGCRKRCPGTCYHCILFIWGSRIDPSRIFMYGVKAPVSSFSFLSFFYGYPVDTAPSNENLMLSPLTCSSTFVINQMAMSGWRCCWTLCLISLVYLFLHVSLP